MRARLAETAVAAATFSVAIMVIASFWDYSLADMAALTITWGIWACARHTTHEYARYVLALALLIPAAAVFHAALEHGLHPVMLVLPPLARAGMLLSVPGRMLAGCVLVARDIRRVVGG